MLFSFAGKLINVVDRQGPLPWYLLAATMEHTRAKILQVEFLYPRALQSRFHSQHVERLKKMKSMPVSSSGILANNALAASGCFLIAWLC
jgi:hypothetical protein